MPRRVLELVVTGEDQSGPALTSAGSNLESLGSKAAGVGRQMPEWYGAWERYNQTVGEVPGVAKPAAAAIDGTGKASSGAIQPLMQLAGSLGLITRRAAVAGGRVGRLGKTFSSMGGSAGKLALSLGTVAAVALPVIQAIGTMVKIGRVAVNVVTSLGKRFLSWTKLLERSPAALAGLTAGERDAARAAEDLAWAIETLSPSSSRAERGMQSQSQMAEELGRSITKLMGKYPGLSRAAAATAAELEYERRAAMDMIRVHDDGQTSVDKLGGAVTTLGNDVRSALIPALEALAVPALALVNEFGPRMIAWAEDLAKSLSTKVPESIRVTISWLDDLDRALMNIFRGPANLLRGIFGKEPTTPRGPVGVPAFPQYAPSVRTTHPGPRPETHVSGSIDVTVHLTGDLRGVGGEIGRGILSELRTAGLA